jgi:hypothetical protein
VSPSAEVHSLVGRDQLPLYLFGAKSLVRRWPRLQIVVHDDGTLRRRHRVLLRMHLRGARVVTRAEADRAVGRALEHQPSLLVLRAENVRILQLLDYYLVAGHTRVIGMDSDLVFLRTPDRLIRWAECDGEELALYSPEANPKGPHWIRDAFPGTPYVADACCGLVAVQRPWFPDLDQLGSLVARTPPEILWHGRFVTQMFHSLLFGAMATRVDSLGDDYRSGRSEWLGPSRTRVAYHYFASHERSTAEENLVGERDALAQGSGVLLARLLVALWPRRR